MSMMSRRGQLALDERARYHQLRCRRRELPVAPRVHLAAVSESRGAILPLMRSVQVLGVLFLSSALPLTVAARDTRVYVVNSGGDTVSILDPAANKVVGSIRVSPNPHGLVFSPDRTTLYVTSETGNVLDVVDRRGSKVVRRVPLGRRPNNLALTPDGRRLYICIRDEGNVEIVDTRSLTVVKKVPVGKTPHNVYCSADGKWMIATSMGDRKIVAINTETEEPEFEIPLGGVPRPLAVEAGPGGAPNRLFVQLSDFHGFAVVDFAGRRTVGQVLLPKPPPGAKPLIENTFSHGIAIAPDGHTLWVASLLNDSVYLFSLPGLSRVASIRVGHAPDWMTFTSDSKRCFVSNAGADSVSVLDVQARREVARIPVGKVPKRIVAVDLP